MGTAAGELIKSFFAGIFIQICGNLFYDKLGKTDNFETVVQP
jgi:hypothetical protein